MHPVMIISHSSGIYRVESILHGYAVQENLGLGFCAEEDRHCQAHNRLHPWGFQWNPHGKDQTKDPELERELVAPSPLLRDFGIVRQSNRQMDLLQEELM